MEDIRIEINCSTNPFAYIRTGKDVDILLTNLLRRNQDKEIPVTVVQLLFIIVSYLFRYTRIEDRSFKSVMTVLERTAMPSEPGEYELDDETLLENIINYDCDRELKHYYRMFKNNFEHMDSPEYIHTVELCKELIRETKEEDCLQNLACSSENLQARVQASNGQIYEFWFKPAENNLINIQMGEHTGPVIYAEVTSSFPFTYHFGDQREIFRNFISYLLNKCQMIIQERSEQREPIISDFIKNKFNNAEQNNNIDTDELLLDMLTLLS